MRPGQRCWVDFNWLGGCAAAALAIRHQVDSTAPDPTVLATLGILLTADKRPPWGLMIIPLIWCALSGTTLWTMGAPDAWVMHVAALGALGAAVYRVLSVRGQGGIREPEGS
jgi:Family of unknown function (DUF6064)